MILLLIVCLIITFKLIYSSNVIDFFQLDEFNKQERKRIQIYIGNLLEHTPVRPFVVSKKNTDIFGELITLQPGSYHYSNHPGLERKGNQETGHDIDEMVLRSKQLQTFNGWVKISTFADAIRWYDIPTLTKARHMQGKTLQTPYAILMRFRYDTHFGQIKQAIEISKQIPWEKKKSCVIWRGGPSGTGFKNHYESRLNKPSREVLVRKWALQKDTASEIDVGLISKWDYQYYKQYVKNKLSLQDMIGYKYLLSVEGNDVATNLKWAMSSNCVVLMPHPKVESWFTESQLEPWVHYVPVKDDFSDLLSVKRWCDQNPKKCLDIIQQANEYIQPFLNEERDLQIACHVFQEYIRNVEIKVVD